MTIDDLKNIRPIPGFDCVKMKHDIQARIYEETKDMTWEESRAYYENSGGNLPSKASEQEALVLREEPPAAE